MLRFRTLLLATSALIPLGLAPAAANPLGAQVVGGSATVQGQGTASVTVTQTTDSAIINWNTFNIGSGEKTNIVMPGSTSVQLDRVTGGPGPSQIFGSLTSNGRVFLVNPDGILFGARIDRDHVWLPRHHARHRQRRFHGRQVQLLDPRQSERVDRQSRHDHGEQRRLRGIGRAGRAQLRHHHREARHGGAGVRQRLHARLLRRQADHA